MSVDVSVAEALIHARNLVVTSPTLALQQLHEIITVAPQVAEAHRLTGRAWRMLGQASLAEQAELAAIGASVHDPELVEAAGALLENALHVAEPILKARLKQQPTDVAAIRMLAELAARIGRLGDSENLLRRALELAPAFGAARANLATVLYRQNRFAEAVAELDKVMGDEPDNPAHHGMKAAALGRIGGYEEALDLYAELTRRTPRNAKIWMSYGHILKTVGRRDDSISAYRQALAVEPGLGEVWWSLANLKTVRFDDADVAAMESALASGRIGEEDRFHLHFALGKAHEDAARYAPSFTHYGEGNRLRRALISHEPTEISAHVDRIIRTFTPAFVAAHQGRGNPAPDAIFVLGMPRAGSTLIEQILSSHSAIEGTMELPDLPAIAIREGRGHDRGEGTVGEWIEAIADAPPGRLAELGTEYLDRTRIQRKSGKPYFIDKLPNNWLFTGLIHLILPNARIIDARRDPLDCCFSNFKQHFAKGQAFSYDLADMGRYYSDYVRLMSHFDTILPGRVHRVIHEALVDDPESETRRMLACLGLDYEDACLRFYENDRAVRTASSEQVRRPINRDGIGQWRNYAPWLDPLRTALGSAADGWR